MKKILICIITGMFVASLIIIGIGCKKEAAPEEEAIEEAAPEEEAVEEEVVEEEVVELEADLTYWGWQNDSVKNAYAKFKEIYPKVNITFEDMARFDLTPKLLNALIAGSGAPDIVLINNYDIPVFYEEGILDLTERMSPYKDQFVGDLWSKVIRKSDGAILGVPWDHGAAVLFYRKDLFEQYDISPDDIKTWDDYFEIGKDFVQKTNGEIKWQVSTIQMNAGGFYACIAHDHQILTQQLGAGGWFDKDGKIILDGPESIKAMDFLVKMQQSGITMNDIASGEAEIATWIEGTVACFPHGSWLKAWFVSNVPDMSDNFGAMLLPAWEEGGPRGSNLGGSSLYITEQCENPDAAFEFLKFWLMTAEGRIESYKGNGFMELGFIPASEDDFFKQPDDYFGEGWFQTCFESAKQAPVGYDGAHTQEVRDIMGREIGDVIKGNVPVEEGMKEFADIVRLEIGEE